MNRETFPEVDRLVAIVYALCTVAGLIFDAAWAAFVGVHGQGAGFAIVFSVVAAIVLLLTRALLRRRRFAWWTFVILGVASLPLWSANHLGHGVSVEFVFGLVWGGVQLMLLVSRPMRRYVGVGRYR